MRGRGARPAAVLLLLVALLAAGPGAVAQRPPRREGLSEELAALVTSKWEAIKREAAGSPGDEWVGTYSALNGPTISTQLAWSHVSGFTVWWENCSRPHLARVNYGKAVFADGSLRLTAELSEDGPSAYAVGSELVPVKWGEQHFLIPADRMINFAHAVNSTSVEQVESFLMKAEDYEKERKGLPELPRAFQKYLGMKPIRATLSGVGPREQRRPLRVTLDAGRAEGVVPEMKFYLSRPRNIYMIVHVTQVGEHASEAWVLMATFTDGRESAVEPRVGWKLTSRAPADASRYAP